MNIKNKVGLEAEFLLRNNKGKLVFPGDFGFETDEFEILGEFRADAAFSRYQAVGNFFTSLMWVLDKAKENNLTVDFSGVTTITPEQKAEIIRKVGYKSVPPCTNVYKTDILALSDDVVDKKGNIISSRISAGLHVHFSRRMYHETYVKGKLIEASDVNLLLLRQIKSMVREMDKKILPIYQPKATLKYRQPGFYEMKPWGFEYRSLPMSIDFTDYNNVRHVVDFAFSLLEKLEK